VKIKGDINVNVSKPHLQALYMAGKLEFERYKGITLSDLTEQVKALYTGVDKVWDWINYSKDEDKRPINRMEWESLLFSAQMELRRYKDIPVRHLRADLMDLDDVVVNIELGLKIATKVTA